MLYIQNISETFSDFPNNEDLAVIVFFQGCIHNCPGCYNKDLQWTHEEKSVTLEEAKKKIEEACERSNTDKIVFSGGDPFFSVVEKNNSEILQLIDFFENNGYQICVYTGYAINTVNFIYNNSLFTKPSFVKCGTYQEALRVNDSGKSEDSLTLITTNQAFFKKNKDSFIQISDNNVLHF